MIKSFCSSHGLLSSLHSLQKISVSTKADLLTLRQDGSRSSYILDFSVFAIEGLKVLFRLVTMLLCQSFSIYKAQARVQLKIFTNHNYLAQG